MYNLGEEEKELIQLHLLLVDAGTALRSEDTKRFKTWKYHTCFVELPSWLTVKRWGGEWNRQPWEIHVQCGIHYNKCAEKKGEESCQLWKQISELCLKGLLGIPQGRGGEKGHSNQREIHNQRHGLTGKCAHQWKLGQSWILTNGRHHLLLHITKHLAFRIKASESCFSKYNYPTLPIGVSWSSWFLLFLSYHTWAKTILRDHLFMQLNVVSSPSTSVLWELSAREYKNSCQPCC